MAKLGCWLVVALVCGCFATATAQNAISAKAGLVQVADGEVFVNDKAIQTKIAEFTDLKNADILRTAEGRTEVLLTPGAFLRMGDTSSFRMNSTRLNDVRLEVLRGEALVEITELLNENAITVNLGSASFQLTKGGIYRFDVEPARMQVYDGEAIASVGDKFTKIKEGHQFSFNGTSWASSDFDKKDTDALYRWSQRRAEGIAVANVSAARQSGNSLSGYGSYGYTGWGSYLGWGGYGYGGYGYGGGWMYNPYFGMFTFLPYYGTAWSPFGYAYYTPITVVPVYAYTQIPQPRGPGRPVNPGIGHQQGRSTTASALRPTTVGGNGVRTPAFTSSAAGLRTSAVTRGGTVQGYSGGHSGFSSGAGYFGGGRSAGYASSSVSSVNSVSTTSSPSAIRSAPAAGGGGRSH